MKPATEMKLLNAMKGYTISQALRRLEIMECYLAQKQLEQRIRICGLNIGG